MVSSLEGSEGEKPIPIYVGDGVLDSSHGLEIGKNDP